MRIYKVVLFIILKGIHEDICHCYGEVEVVQFGLVLFCGNKSHDIGMVDAQDTHVGAPSGAALCDRLCG